MSAHATPPSDAPGAHPATRDEAARFEVAREEAAREFDESGYEELGEDEEFEDDDRDEAAGLADPTLTGAALAPAVPQRLASARALKRKVPKAKRIARRRAMILLTKWFLPLCAVLLLGSIAAWPELDRARDAGRVAFRRAFSVDPDAARLVDPHYRGMDERNRPYTITADTAQQVGLARDGTERVNLAEPRGDATTESGGWLYVRSKDGVYSQHLGQLDLSHDVILYRDDGTTLTSDTADVDMKTGAASSDSRTHAEGPFGTLDAQGYALVDKGAVVQFTGPARLLLNQGH